MKGLGNFRFTVYLLALCGAGLLTFLLLRNGIGDIMQAVAAARWGVLAVALYHLVPLAFDTLSWRSVFPRAERPAFRVLYGLRWIGESVGNLVPASSVGGDLLRARLASLKGASVSASAASVLADITLGVFTQAVFTLFGVALLIYVTGRTSIIGPALAGVPLVILAVGGFYAVQRVGIFRLIGGLVKRLASDPSWHSLIAKGGGIDDAVRSIYGNRRAVVSCCACTLSAWVSGSVEVWIALNAVGVHAGLGEAIIMESICQGMRAAVFFIPGALGVQEGGYVVIGGLLGISAETALVLALIRRSRELALGIPGLLFWQFGEGHRLWRSRALQPAE